MCSLFGWWTYTTDPHVAEAVNTTVRLVLLFVGGCVLLVLLVRYGLPAFWQSAESWSRLQDARVEGHLKLTRYAPSATGMYEIPAPQMDTGVFMQAMQAATVHSQYEEPRYAFQGTHAPAVLPGTSGVLSLPDEVWLRDYRHQAGNRFALGVQVRRRAADAGVAGRVAPAQQRPKRRREKQQH